MSITGFAANPFTAVLPTWCTPLSTTHSPIAFLSAARSCCVRTKRQLERWVSRGVAYARSLPPKG